MCNGDQKKKINCFVTERSAFFKLSTMATIMKEAFSTSSFKIEKYEGHRLLAIVQLSSEL